MSAKPTPGPMKVKSNMFGDSLVMTSDDVIVAMFFNKIAFGIDMAEAEANARGWVDGMAALEKLDRIRKAMNSTDWGESKLVKVYAILDEAKP